LFIWVSVRINFAQSFECGGETVRQSVAARIEDVPLCAVTFQRSQVRKQLEEGTYRFEDDVEVYSLVEPWKFRKLGMGKLTHDPETGLAVCGKYNGRDYQIVRPPLGMYGVHVEYDYCYVRPDDCIDISTDLDSLYCYPTKNGVVTKLSFATEELYRHKMEGRAARRRARLLEKEAAEAVSAK
jgi:hypothetical protein